MCGMLAKNETLEGRFGIDSQTTYARLMEKGTVIANNGNVIENDKSAKRRIGKVLFKQERLHDICI